MATNKFATLIHRRANRITLVLVYAFLEWALIFFIFLNSLFSYFTLRFADFFGLKRPCLFCSRLDRFFDSSGKSPSFRDLSCENHALQISHMRFCYNHGKFSESGDFCEDCSFSNECHKDLIELCSCCGVRVERRARSPCAVIESDSEILGFRDDEIPIGEEIPIRGEIPAQLIQSNIVREEENARSIDSSDSHGRSCIRDEETEGKLLSEDEKKEEEEENRGIQIVPEFSGEREEVIDGSDINDDDETEEEFSSFISSFDCNKKPSPTKEEENKADLVMEELVPQVEPRSDEPTGVTQKHLEFYIGGQDCHLIPVEFFGPGEEVREISDSSGDLILDFGAEADFSAENAVASPEESKQDDDREAVNVDLLMMADDSEQNRSKILLSSYISGSSADEVQQRENVEEDDAEVSIGTEIPDHEEIGDASSHETTPQAPQDRDDDDSHDVSDGEEMLEFRPVTFKTKRPFFHINVTANEEKLPETPGSPDSLGNIHYHLDSREYGTEDSLNSEIECPDGVLTIDNLKAALREERKVLNALCAELEEERNASAVAANETMAMINRLQEEKAAMQMEALQYQRMMEEQTEYDQEALMLMNDLMVKREKELELYKKRVEGYEVKEMEIVRRRTDERCDEMMEMKNTPVDAVFCLDECLADFEGERISILRQLKVLEEKLSELNDDGEDMMEDENGHGRSGENGHFHGKRMNGNHHKTLKSKRLLPLFDAAVSEIEIENGLSNGNHHENGSENGGIAIDEEIDELYERLEALEADREFMRHCIGSLRKGDKGVYLLQEILQHLRDLRNVELHTDR